MWDASYDELADYANGRRKKSFSGMQLSELFDTTDATLVSKGSA